MQAVVGVDVVVVVAVVAGDIGMVVAVTKSVGAEQ